MKAVVVRRLGPPDGFRIEEVDTAPLGRRDVRVAIRAAGVSFVDLLLASGGHQERPPLPYVPGTECAGVVQAVGDDIAEFRVGQRVSVLALAGGAYAETITIDASDVAHLPDDMSFDEGAVFRASYGTAYHALVQRGLAATGETLLVLGGGGALGLAAIQVGKALGLRVIASATTAAKRAATGKAGADATVDGRGDDWRGSVRAHAPDGVDIVFDPVGGALTETAFRTLRWGGRHLVIGFAGGAIAALPANLTLLKGASLIGVNIRRLREIEPARERANLDKLYELHGAGQLRTRIAARYPFSEFRAALAAATEAAAPGRIIISLAPDIDDKGNHAC